MAGVGGDGDAGSARAGAADQHDTGRISYLDRALWQQFRDAASPDDFARFWLALQCRMIGGASRAIVVLGEPDVGPFRPVANWPHGEDSSAGLKAAIELALAERRGIARGAQSGGGIDDLRRCEVAYPLIVDERLHGAVAVELEGRAGPGLRGVMRELQWGTAWIEVMLRRQRAADGGREREQTAIALDMVAAAIEEERFNAACNATVTELATALDCERVAVGFLRHGHATVAAVSHSAQFGRRMNLIRSIGLAMDEGIDQGTILHFPPLEGAEFQVTRAHDELARQHGQGSILTIPLTSGDRTLGALTFQRA